MSRRRKFDWGEAARLRETGLTYTEIGGRLGVSAAAVYRALNDEHRQRNDARAVAWQRAGVCPDCGGPATRWSKSRQCRCRECSNREQTMVGGGDALCCTCKNWLPTGEFTRDRSRPFRGLHNECRGCQTKRRRAYREARKVPCVRCGGPRLSDASGNGRGETGLCLSCYRARAVA